jgi:hypothetical protein
MAFTKRVLLRRFNLLRLRASTVLQYALLPCLLLVLAGCLLIPEDRAYRSLTELEKGERQIYKLYSGQPRPANELAIVLLGDIPSVTVDGLGTFKADYQEIHLMPGRHALAWRKVFGFSVMVEPAMMKEAGIELDVELKAGHTYKLFADRTTGHGYRFYFWIADTLNGEVIGGVKKP